MLLGSTFMQLNFNSYEWWQKGSDLRILSQAIKYVITTYVRFCLLLLKFAQ